MASFVVPSLFPAPSDPHAMALEREGLLRLYLSGSHKPIKGLGLDVQKHQSLFFAAHFAATRFLGPYPGECFRFSMSPFFEEWVIRNLKSGDSLLCGLGYFNRAAGIVHDNGGLLVLDARNSHPSNFWSLVAEEHARWGCRLPPIWPRHHLRQQRSVALADYILAPSRFVEESFVDRGFPKERVLRLPYPVDLSVFQPPTVSRPANQPLTIVSSGLLTLRKGSPYIFEAFKIIRKQVPDARLRLVHKMADSFQPVFEKCGYGKLPVDWAERMPHDKLRVWLGSSDVFVLPTIEEGMVRSAAEAMACGLPVITTRNAGIDDWITDGVNGSIIPIRDPGAIAMAVLEWWERIRTGEYEAGAKPSVDIDSLGFDSFCEKFAGHLKTINHTIPTKL